jgi:MFS family permease
LATLGSYGSVSGAAMLLLSLPLGRLSDRLGRKRLMIPGLLLFILVPLSYMIVKNPVQLYPVRIALGLGTGLIFGNGFLLMSEISSPAFRNRAQGLYMTSMGLGFTLGPLVGGFAATLYGFKISFIISSSLAVAALTILLLISESFIATTQNQMPFRFRGLLQDARVLASGIANFLNSLMFNAVTLFFPVYGENIGFNEAEIGLGLTARGLASTTVRLPIGVVAKYINVLSLMITGLVLSAVALFAVSTFSTLIIISTLMGIQGIAYGVFLTTGNIYVAEESPQELRGTSMALYSMFGYISSIVNPLILGFLAERFGSKAALQFSALASVLLVLPVYFLGRRREQSTNVTA